MIGGIIGGMVAGKLMDGITRPSGRSEGGRMKDMMDAAYPGTTPWERLGGGGGGTAGVVGSMITSRRQATMAGAKMGQQEKLVGAQSSQVNQQTQKVKAETASAKSIAEINQERAKNKKQIVANETATGSPLKMADKYGNVFNSSEKDKLDEYESFFPKSKKKKKKMPIPKGSKAKPIPKKLKVFR